MHHLASILAPRNPAGGNRWLVVAAAFLLAALAIADRTAAWLLGQFPTSAALWELRFGYLRPISVFHDLVVKNLGDISAASFNIGVGMIAVAVAFGALSGVRLARALAHHALLAATLVLAVYSFDAGEGVYATVGAPSAGYLLIGVVLTAGAAFMCASSHCEYLGWSPGSSRLMRRVSVELARLQARLLERAADGLTMPLPGRAQASLVRARRSIR
jgi:hypothetical protein